MARAERVVGAGRNIAAQASRLRPPMLRLAGEPPSLRGAPAPRYPALTAEVRRVGDVCLERLNFAYRFIVKGENGAFADDAQGGELRERIGQSFEDQFRAGVRVLLVAFGVGGGWATLVPLSGAVVVPGTLVAESNVKKVQHQTGGIVAKIVVHDGAHVKEGDLLVRLDETQARSGLEVIAKQLDETRVRIARLVAERDGVDDVKLPRELAARGGDKDLQLLFASEKSLFKARGSARASQKQLLRSRIDQLKQEIEGFTAQIKSKAAQRDLISGELQGVQSLFDKRLVPLARLTSLQRDAANLDGEQGQLQSSIAETQGKISEAELQIVQVDQQFRSDVVKDLREAEDKAAELTQKHVAAQDVLNRIDIRSPTSGIVHDLVEHTIGGVIAPGEVLMQIVPDSDDLQIEAKLHINDIDQVHMGQKTNVRFATFNQRTTPSLNGFVSYVSADSTVDKQTNVAFYTVRVTLPEQEVKRLGGLQLVSGMPAQVFLETGSRTMFSYLTKPIAEQMHRAFSER
ncbi:MAG TPA: HlyD family type I secretion periplasmic adaptor subunit [Xanthobacteraceae bacterium]|nr:HlyD family type I secretion periplasmic adaptor subunit [Xanthobacteraceae bacterium]